MRKMVVLIALFGLVLVGQVAPVGADPGSRPFKGSVSGEATFPFVGLDVCPASELFYGGLRTESVVEGTASHLGITRMTSEHCTPAGEAITGGEMKLVAANGDAVHIRYSGSAPFPTPDTEVIVVDIDFEIVGGTGRFEGATGGGDMTAEIVFEGFLDPAWPATWVWAGTIGY